MSAVWYSQLFENTHDGGVLLALPWEGLADWDGTGEDYDEVIEEPDQFLIRPLGSTAGLFVGDFDGEGIHEAHWMRLDGRLILVVWSSWDDPARPGFPEDAKKVARAWEQRVDPRQRYLEERLRRGDLAWDPHASVQRLASGVLLLLHAEGKPRSARFPSPRSVAKCGQVVPAGVEPGDYRIETTLIDELPDGAHLCAVCRWVPAGGSAPD